MAKGQYERTPEIREKMRIAATGFKHSEETKKKISEISKRQKPKIMSQEARRKISDIKKGKKNPKITGSNHYNWKGGVTTLNMVIRSSIKMRQWRCDVYQRDDYTCQWCGQRGGKLNADHIKSFSDIMREYKIKSLEDAESCEELWNINNGRTLCVKCHWKTDNYGGNSKRKNIN